MTFGERVRLARDAAGLSQQQVADAIGVHRISVNRYEAAGASPKHFARIEQLAAAMRVRALWLATGEGPMRKRKSAA